MSDPGQAVRSARSWKRAADGIQLVVFGTFLLLTTQGRLPWSFWVEAATLWPLLLVGAGIRIAFDKSRAPWVALASPLLVAAALIWVARGGRTEAPGEWVPQKVERPDDVDSFRLSAHGTLGRLDVRARSVAASVLAEGRSASREGGERVLVRRSDHVAEVALRGGQHSWSLLTGPRRESWQLDVAPDLPMRLDLQGAGLTGHIDLAEGRFAGGRMDGVFNTLELRLPAPTEEATVTLDGVMNALQLSVPPGTAVHVESEGVFNIVDRLASGEGPAYRVRVHGVMNVVGVTEQAPLAHEAPVIPPR